MSNELVLPLKPELAMLSGVNSEIINKLQKQAADGDMDAVHEWISLHEKLKFDELLTNMDDDEFTL